MRRRQFLELSSLSSAAWLLGPSLEAGAQEFPVRPTRARHAAFHTLAASDIRPEGWVRLYLQKQAEQLGGHLTEISKPFDGDYWSGEETPPNFNVDAWWPWEQKAYWIEGTLRCALALQDEKLLKVAMNAIDYTLDHANRDGYLGPGFLRYPKDKDKEGGFARWPHTLFFRALTAYSEASGDARVTWAMRRHYLADEYRVIYGNPGRDVTNIESMLWVYSQTGDKQMLAMAEKAWNEFLHSRPPENSDPATLQPERVFANAPIRSHGVTYIETAKLPAILYMYTGKAEYLRYAVAAQQRVFSHHMLIDGIPSASEAYRGTNPLDSHESCDITDHMWSWGYLLQATGDGIWGDHIERACFNAGFGAIKKDWKAVQYFSCPNQVIATEDSSHVPYIELSKGWMAYRPNPGRHVACCGANIHRFFPNYVVRMWMADAKGGMAAVLYGASMVQAKVGANHEPIQIREETHYPFDEEIHFTLGLAKPVAFPLSLRIPSWCKEPSLALNGKALARPVVRNGFVKLERIFHPGDRVTLVLPMRAVTTAWPDDGIGVEHGPLVYALAVKEDWTSVVTPHYSTAEFPEWNATPASVWNYALTLAPERLESQTKLERKAMTDDPWVDPPVALTVPAKKVPGWDLRTPSEHPERKQTPPLPQIHARLSDALMKAEVEQLTLVPYGSTHLRLTIFPKAS